MYPYKFEEEDDDDSLATTDSYYLPTISDTHKCSLEAYCKLIEISFYGGYKSISPLIPLYLTWLKLQEICAAESSVDCNLSGENILICFDEENDKLEVNFPDNTVREYACFALAIEKNTYDLAKTCLSMLRKVECPQIKKILHETVTAGPDKSPSALDDIIRVFAEKLSEQLIFAVGKTKRLLTNSGIVPVAAAAAAPPKEEVKFPDIFAMP